VSVSISVVSHGHGAQVLALLQLLSAAHDLSWCQRIWITINVPEPKLLDDLRPWQVNGEYCIGQIKIFVIVNQRPLGFGANHNQAFLGDRSQHSPSKYFVVMNPDISWSADPWLALLDSAGQSQVGCVYPVQIDDKGRLQDYRRLLPTPWALWKRHVLKSASEQYVHIPDWVSAALLLFPAEVFAEIQGFDERYHMYCEDVDICLRLQLAGYRLVEVPNACVTHTARRASRSDAHHLLWHVQSLWRLWFSPACWRFWRQRHALRTHSPRGQ